MKSRETTGRQDPKIRILSILYVKDLYGKQKILKKID